MRAVIQRVLSANASMNGEIVSSIGKGLCVLIGISRNDTKRDIEFIVKKILNSKLFEDSCGKRWSKSVKDCGGEILCLSQVTLYNTFKGNKLDFHHAMAPDKGREFYHEFLEHIRSEYNPELVKEGIFGAHLVIGIQNDGPVTITLESPNAEENQETMEQDICSSLTTKCKTGKSESTKIAKQNSTSSQTCLIEQGSAYSQTVRNSDLSTISSQTDLSQSCTTSNINQDTTSSQTRLVKQDSTSSQTCLITQDTTSSQTCLMEQDSNSSQTCYWVGDNGKQNDISSQTLKEWQVLEGNNGSVYQDSKFSQTTNVIQSNVSSQTRLVTKDTVSSQTCSRRQEPNPNSVMTQTPAFNVLT